MSSYIISDIHGDLRSFKKILKEIEFNEQKDFLIINGDVLDRGEQGINTLFIVKTMVENGGALMIKGNHELFAQMYMEGTLSERRWILFSGEATLRDLKSLTDEKGEEILSFIRQMPLYIERDIPKFGKTVITHSGLIDDCLVTRQDGIIGVAESIELAKKMDEYQLLVSADIHYWGCDRLAMLDKYIICGHVPTYQLDPEYTGKILETRAYMDIDAGAGYREQGGKLACYCIDSGDVVCV